MNKKQEPNSLQSSPTIPGERAPRGRGQLATASWCLRRLTLDLTPARRRLRVPAKSRAACPGEGRGGGRRGSGSGPAGGPSGAEWMEEGGRRWEARGSGWAAWAVPGTASQCGASSGRWQAAHTGMLVTLSNVGTPGWHSHTSSCSSHFQTLQTSGFHSYSLVVEGPCVGLCMCHTIQ